MVAQQNQINDVATPRVLVLKRGRIRSPEKDRIFSRITPKVDRAGVFFSATWAISSPSSQDTRSRSSEVSHVFVPLRPPDGQEGEKSAGSIREELEEESAIDWKIATNSKAQGGEQEADAAPALSVSGHDPEYAGDKQRGVEGDATAKEVGSNAPEETANGETNEKGAGSVSNCLFVDAELA
ncbi:hypothetical protein HG530_013442 [Fusarium avenaceum]|nr:hypothetical protein HG530_013442 [Fusarium avenaceum]